MIWRLEYVSPFSDVGIVVQLGALSRNRRLVPGFKDKDGRNEARHYDAVHCALWHAKIVLLKVAHGISILVARIHYLEPWVAYPHHYNAAVSRLQLVPLSGNMCIVAYVIRPEGK